MRARITLLLAVPLLVAATACGGSDDAGSDATDAAVTGATDAVATTDAPDAVETSVAPAETEDASDVVVPPPSDGGTAVLTLDNGETFEFEGVMCTLEPQIAAGSEILFTATSYGDPGIDITQFGDEGTITGVATIDVYDGEYETVWSAFSLGGSAVELTLDGSTIRGSGTFYDDVSGSAEPVLGEVVANC